MSRVKVYIAGPISTGDIVFNVVRATRAATDLIEQGYAVFCPQLSAFMGYEQWMQNDLPWVECADVVLRLPGESRGADEEIAHAENHGIPVVYHISDLPDPEGADGDEVISAQAECNEGHIEQFASGSIRDNREGKGRYDLLPAAAIRRLAQHFERGAAKYGDRNWEKGQPISRYLDSGLRHVFNHLDGKTDEDHLAAAAWNILAAIWTQEKINAGQLPKELLS